MSSPVCWVRYLLPKLLGMDRLTIQRSHRAACAALIHGLAGCLAAASGRPVTSEDVLSSVPEAIARLRARDGDDR